MKWIPPQPTGLFTVLMYGPFDGPSYGGEMETRVATGLPREKASALAGLLLNCPIYTTAKLQAEMTAGHWEEEAGDGE